MFYTGTSNFIISFFALVTCGNFVVVVVVVVAILVIVVVTVASLALVIGVCFVIRFLDLSFFVKSISFKLF